MVRSPSTIKEILLTIKTRGPLAYTNFIRSLQQSGQGLLAEILDLNESVLKIIFDVSNINKNKRI